MNIVIYKAKIKSGYLYDMSFHPNVDYEILRNTRNIEGIEVMTPFIPLEKGEEILRKIYGKSIFKKFAPNHDFYIKQGMKKIKSSDANRKTYENLNTVVANNNSDKDFDMDISAMRTGVNIGKSASLDIGIGTGMGVGVSAGAGVGISEDVAIAAVEGLNIDKNIDLLKGRSVEKGMISTSIGESTGSSTIMGKFINTGIIMPASEDIATVESCITGKVVTLRWLFQISQEIGLSEEQILDVVQILYCERRIRIVPSTKKIRGKYICSFCEKVSCNECCMDFLKDDILLYAADNYNIGIPREVNFKKKKMNDSLSKAFDGVNSFMENNKKHNAIVWCVPGSYDYSVLSEAMSKVIIKGGKLLYVTSTLSLVEAEQELNNVFEDVSIAIVDRHTLKYKDIDITLCSYNDYLCFHKAFDLVVLDERMIYIEKTLKNMLSICKRAVKENGKLIHITHLPDLKSKDNILSSNELITIPVNSSRSPIPEPLIVISRLLNESVPEMVIDTINWSMKENQKMLIFVPTEEIRRSFYNKLLTLMDISGETIEFSTTKDKTSIIKLKKKELQLVISDDFRDTMTIIDDLNVIVMNADHDAYSKEILLNMSAMAVYHTKKKCGQVIFVVEKECDSVTKTKESIRGINKIAWENGYIKK